MRAKSDIERGCILNNLERREWKRVSDDSWNIYFSNVYNAKMLFNPDAPFWIDENRSLWDYVGYWRVFILKWLKTMVSGMFVPIE